MAASTDQGTLKRVLLAGGQGDRPPWFTATDEQKWMGRKANRHPFDSFIHGVDRALSTTLSAGEWSGDGRIGAEETGRIFRAMQLLFKWGAVLQKGRLVRASGVGVRVPELRRVGVNGTEDQEARVREIGVLFQGMG